MTIKSLRIAHFIPLLLLVALPLIIERTAVAEVNEPEAAESLSNWETARRLTNETNSPNGAQRPNVAVAPNGTLIVVYLKQQSSNSLDTDPFYRKSTDGGVNWTSPLRIHTSAAFSRQVYVAFDNNNSAHAVWTEGDNQLWYGKENVWSSNGSEQLFSNADILIESPKIAVDANGVLHIVWSQVGFVGQDVFYSRSTNGGNTWTSPANISNSSGSSESPAMAIDSSNRVNVVWEQQISGSNYQAYFSRRGTAGVWSTPVGISTVVPNISAAREPDITIAGNRIAVVFEDRVLPSEQYLYYMECQTNCTADPPTTAQWQFRPATVQAYAAKDSDPTFLGPKVVPIGQCRTIFFSGITGNPATDDEKVRLSNSCNGFGSNPIIGAVEDSLGQDDRAIKPAVAVERDWLVYLVYELKSPTRSDIYLVKSQPAIYLPTVLK